MPNLDEIKNQMKQANVTNTFTTKKEINFLPQILTPNEKIKYMTSGFWDSNTWLITCTNKRVIFLDKGMFFGLKQKEIPLEKINSICQQRGIVFGKIEIWDGASRIVIENIDKSTLQPMLDAINVAREELKQSYNTIQSCKSSIAVNKQDIPDQIRKLAILKEEGILTEDEFNKKKTELLAKL